MATDSCRTERMRALLACLLSSGLLGLSLLAPAAHAAPRLTPFALCEGAISRAAAVRGLPDGLLPALAQVESGRPDAAGAARPWPWTIDVDGQGKFFATKAEAVTAVRALQDLGVRSIDVGCLQVNLMYHPNAFASLDQAFDPAANTLYAARFLLALYGRDGDWTHAIAAYHSETPRLGAPYRARVMALWHPGGQQTAMTAALTDPRRAAYADFLPTVARYADFAGCRCVSTPGKQSACRCD